MQYRVRVPILSDAHLLLGFYPPNFNCLIFIELYNKCEGHLLSDSGIELDMELLVDVMLLRDGLGTPRLKYSCFNAVV